MGFTGQAPAKFCPRLIEKYIEQNLCYHLGFIDFSNGKVIKTWRSHPICNQIAKSSIHDAADGQSFTVHVGQVKLKVQFLYMF